MTVIELVAVKELAPFDFRWPENIEWFERGWSFDAAIGGAQLSGRHGIGEREVYGRMRVHTVTWIAGEVQVEGVEADDYPSSQALISRLRRVFLRTGLVEHDDVNRMVAVARALNPDRPGALDLPAWDIGRRWCRPTDPDCAACPLCHVCPRLIDRASSVRGA